MEVLYEGWLTKSPPEKSKWKIYKAKWRRRYFVLHERDTADSFPGVRAALDYYKDKSRKESMGSIDLNHCEEVLSSLDSSVYRHLFALTTKFKAHNRTYYLAADSDAEMNSWVDCLCKVLGLKENNEEPVIPPSAPESTLQRQQQPRRLDGYIGVNPGSPAGHRSPAGSIGSRSPSSTLGRRSPHTSPQPAAAAARGDLGQEEEFPPGERRNSRTEAYINLDTCYSGTPTNQAVEVPLPVKTGEARALTIPTADQTYQTPPTQQASSQASNYINLSADGDDSDDNIYKVPPSAITDDNDNVYKVPPRAPNRQDDFDTDDLYKVPPVNHLKFKNTTGIASMYNDDRDSIYKVPPMAGGGGGRSPSEIYDIPPTGGCARVSISSGGSRHSSQGDPELGHLPPARMKGPASSQQQDIYDHPPQAQQPGTMFFPGRLDSVYDVPPTNAGLHHVTAGVQGLMAGDPRGQGELYDAPPMRNSPARQLAELVPPPRPSKPGDEVITDTRYINLPPETGKKHTMGPPSVAIDDMYDYPPNSANHAPVTQLKDLSPPPPCHSPAKTHKYVNAPTSNSHNVPMEAPVPAPHRSVMGPDLYLPMAGGGGDSYMPMAGGRSDSTYGYVPPGRDSTISTDSVYTVMAQRESAASGPPGDDDMYQVPPPPMLKPVKPVMKQQLQQQQQQQLPPHGVHEADSPIVTTHRTRSFKRSPSSIHAPPPQPYSASEVLLPTRKPTTGGSSSDDDSSSDDEPPTAAASRQPAASKPPGVTSLQLKPPAPGSASSMRRLGPGEVEYLDLDHGGTATPPAQEAPDSPISRVSTMTMSSTLTRGGGGGNTSPTEYNEIDFVKTMALSETRRIVENKRKSSERSIDD